MKKVDALATIVIEQLIKSDRGLEKIVSRLLAGPVGAPLQRRTAGMLIESDRGLEKLLEGVLGSDEALNAALQSIIASDEALGFFVDRLVNRMIESDRMTERIADAIIADDKVFQVLVQFFDTSEIGQERIKSLRYDLRKNQESREEWLERALRDLPAGCRILDAGAGEQQYKKFCTHLQYVSQDFAKYDGSGDNKGLQIGKWNQAGLDIVSDITSIPEPDASFDAIMCVEVFEHLPNPVLAIAEFSRLLRPGGTLIITAPFCSMTHFAPYHFSTGFNHYYYELYLEAHGLKIKEILANGNYFDYVSQEIRRISYVASRYTTEKADFKENLAMDILIKMLERCSQSDQGSQELLNFGYHIRAEKLYK